MYCVLDKYSITSYNQIFPLGPWAWVRVQQQAEDVKQPTLHATHAHTPPPTHTHTHACGSHGRAVNMFSINIDDVRRNKIAKIPGQAAAARVNKSKCKGKAGKIKWKIIGKICNTRAPTTRDLFHASRHVASGASPAAEFLDTCHAAHAASNSSWGSCCSSFPLNEPNETRVRQHKILKCVRDQSKVPGVAHAALATKNAAGILPEFGQNCLKLGKLRAN